MEIDHIAIWTNDLEKMKEFYSAYFNCVVSDRYDNTNKRFSSYFLSFPNGARIELMKRADIYEPTKKGTTRYAHISINVGTSTDVDTFTKYLENNGVTIESYPRTTGDGYYESVVLDPENNSIELVASR